MCLVQDAMTMRFDFGPNSLMIASFTLFYAVQLARNVLPGRSVVAVRAS
jgi:hypothetical protein